MAYIGTDELANMNIERTLADYYLLERLTADGSRSARIAQRKLEAWAAPRLLRYLAAICGGEMRHYGLGGGCNGWDCHGDYEADPDECSCCGYGIDEHESMLDECSHCGMSEEGCSGEDEDGNAACGCFCPLNEASCDCYCPQGGMCSRCEDAANFDAAGLPGRLVSWLESNHGISRSGAWAEFLAYHDRHGSMAMMDLWNGFEDEAWCEGYGGEAWAFIARVGYEYQAGKMSAHAFMDRCWTLQHNGGNIFDKMHDASAIRTMLDVQAADEYGRLATHASPEVKGLWAIRPYVLSDSLDRSPEWLGREVPEGVEW